MEIEILKLKNFYSRCNYLPGLKSNLEGMQIPDIEFSVMDKLLETGFRHFADHFFRPICRPCRQCIPIRVPVDSFILPRSGRRLLKENQNFRIKLHKPALMKEAFPIYLSHQQRFDRKGVHEYKDFVYSFFYPLKTAYQLSVFDKKKLIAVSHLDITPKSMSGIYNYYDLDYAPRSPGNFLIYQSLLLAKKMGIQYYYLGFYVPDNPHMRYKIKYKPNQLLAREGRWLDFLDKNGHILDADLPRQGFEARFPVHKNGLEKILK